MFYTSNSLFHFSVSLEQLIQDSKLRICWTHDKGDLKIPFDGVPYVWLGNCDFQCHQGADKNVAKKQKYFEEQKEKLKSDHSAPVKMRRLTQPTNKTICDRKISPYNE